jgi:hypothetical protein
MLEQRVDSKYIQEAGVLLAGKPRSVQGSPVISIRFVDENNVTTAPENTSVTNLSLNSTSSLPYFDGISRNR